MVKHMRYFLLCCFLMLLPQWANAAASASLDQQITSLGESVLLTIKVEGDADGEPDLTPLKRQFDILSQSKSSNYSIINGSINKSKQWLITLMPRQSGVFVIPILTIGSMQTNALKLQVLDRQAVSKTQQSRDIFLEVKASSAEVYVQAQLILTVKLFRAVNLAQANLSEPEVAHTVMKRIGQDRNYETVLNQRRFVVTERKYALFPQKSGAVEVPALQFNGRISSGRGMFGQTAKAMRLQSEPINIKVLTKPDIWDKSKTWLPAKELSLRELWSDGQNITYKVGEPFTRTIEIRATGLTAAQLPILFSTQTSNEFKQYPDQPVLDDDVSTESVVGVRMEKVAFIPIKAGEMTLPSLSIKWWNTQAEEIQTMMIPGRVIDILPADNVSSAPLVKSEKTANNKDAAQIDQQEVKPAEAKDIILWQVLTLFFALIWLLTLLFWWLKVKSRQQNNIKDGAKNTSLKLKSIQRGLESACKQNSVERAMLLLPKWGNVYFNDEYIQHFSQLKGRSKKLDIALDELDEFKYSQGAQSPWSGDKLLQIVKTLDRDQRHEVDKEGLKKLYN